MKLTAKFSDVERLLVIKHGAFGDVIQTMGAFEDIRMNFANAKISVLTEPAFRKIYERCPYVDEVVLDDRSPRWRGDKMLSLRNRIARVDPHIIFDLQNSGRTEFYRNWLFKKTSWSFVANPRSPDALFPKSMPSLQRLDGQLTRSGLATSKSLLPDISWLGNDVSAILDEAGVKEPFIVLIPGCSAKHPHKRWPHYGALAQRLIDEGWSVVTVPGPDEMELSATIPGTMLTGGKFLDWFDLTGVMKRAAFVVGNDTGPMHIAAHLDRPGLALFGPHTTAASTSVEGRIVDAIETADLSALAVEDVLSATLSRLKSYSNSV